MTLLSLVSDPRTVPVLAASIVLLRVLYALVSRLVQPYPRIRAIVEALAALGPDIGRALLQLASAWLGRPISLDVRAPDHDVAALRAERDLLRARVAELAAAAEEHRSPRPTLAPDEGTAERIPGTRGAL